MTFYFRSCLVALLLGLTTVMVIYAVGIGSHNSTECRQQYNYSVERNGDNCRLLGFPTAYIENDVWGHNAHVYPFELGLNVFVWSLAWGALLSLMRNPLARLFGVLSTAHTTTRSAIIIEFLAVPLVVIILLVDFPIRRADVSDIFFQFVNKWSVLYVPLPVIAVLGILLGMVGLFRNSSILKPALCVPFLLAAWVVFAMMFVGWIPEVV